MTDSQMMIVEYWPKGYADAEGLSRLELPDGSDYVSAIKRKAAWATLAGVRPKNPKPVPAVSEEYARIMSARDNS